MQSIILRRGFISGLTSPESFFELVLNPLKDSKITNSNIQYLPEDNLSGTAGALFIVWQSLQDEFLVIDGNIFFDIDYQIILDFIQNNEISALVALKYTKNLNKYDFLSINETYNVISFEKRNNLPENKIDGYINSGMYYFKKNILEKYYADWSGEAISLEEDIFPKMIEEKTLYGLPAGGKFVNIAESEDYAKTRKELSEWIKKERKPALFLDRDGIIIEDTGYAHGTDLNFIEETFELVKEANKQGKYVIVVTNQSGIARGFYTEEDMKVTHEYIIKAYKEKGLKIDHFYYCPYHFEGTEKNYKKISLTRKPNPGMILEACEEYRIDLRKSLMIGDNPKTDRINIPYPESKICRFK